MINNDAPDPNSLGLYRIGREIGMGSFAKVYLGTTLSRPPKTVAIKSVLRQKLTRKLLENLESEISILKSIRHPHIVSLIDITETDSHIHLIMEYCPLGDLSFFIKKREKLGQEGQIPLLLDIARKYPNTPGAGLNEILVRHFLQQLASALQFLRSKNLIHRDVKPQNLLLQPPEISKGEIHIGLTSLPTLKLADFGFARHLQHASMAETLCGSPLYMAPEILRYEKYDGIADLWSAGTVLYEMLVGKPPFRAGNHVELLRKIDKSDDVIKFPSDVLLNEDIKCLIRALLKRNPQDRIRFDDFFAHTVVRELLQSADDIETDLATAIENSMMIRPAHLHEIKDPLERPSSSDRRGITDRDSDHVSNSPAFITDLIPVNTPPSQDARTAGSSNTGRGESSANITRHAFKRRETMPMNNSRPQISPSYRSPVPMERRPSHRAESRPILSDRASYDSSRHSQDRAQDILEYERDHQRSRQNRRVGSEASGRSQEQDKPNNDNEGDYVVVSKTQVEVNTLADAVARSPHAYMSGNRRTVSGRRPSQHSSYNSTGSGQAVNRATVQTLAAAEMRLGSSPAGAIAKALSMAGQRLFGGGSPPFWLDQLVNNARGPSPSKALVKGEAFGWCSNSEEPLSAEEGLLIESLELTAIKGNIVYDFAELKLHQLIPPPPSQSGDESENLLTNEAIVSLCEEAMVLYLKTLSLLQRSIDIVQKWMLRDSFNGASVKLNHVVQWTRDRYNEVLEKAEYLQQKKTTTIALVSPDYPFDEVTAEKLLYDRALEMSRGAAVNEIVGEDLSQCEGDYEISIMMLEAILEHSAEDSQLKNIRDSIEDEDRKAIEKWVNLTRIRLDKLRLKLDHMRSNSGSQATAMSQQKSKELTITS